MGLKEMINVPYLTYPVVTHCTLSCDGCLSKSELKSTKASFIDIDIFEKDVEAVSKFLHAGEFAISGGEALLHKKLVDLLKIVKKYNVSDITKVHTNGQLLDRQSTEFWEHIDLLVLTLYPGTNIDNAYVKKYAEQKCKEYNVIFHCHIPSRFKKIHAAIDVHRDAQKTYNNCDYAHVHKCNTMHHGKYYKCFVPVVNKVHDDGVELNEDSVKHLIESDKHLISCNGCLGTSGPDIMLTQVR